MGLIAQILLMSIILILTFWRKDIILYLITAPISISMGLAWYDIYKTPAGLIMSISLILLGAYCFALGIINMLKGKEN
jgi:hypothetical protein